MARQSRDLWARAAFYATLGSAIPASTVAGYFVGRYFDARLHTGIALSLIGLVAGSAVGIMEVIQLITRTERNAGNSTGRDNRSD